MTDSSGPDGRSAQEEGLIGRMVGGMIRRSLRKSFHTIWWNPPPEGLRGPIVWACSHHAWHDGYLMFEAVSRLGIRTLDWIAEFDSFPLFRHVGGLPFPPGDSARRAATVRSTIRLMREERRSLILFADGTLRRPHEPWEFGSAVGLIRRQVPGVRFVPVGIRLEISRHERPEAFLAFGEPLDDPEDLRGRVEDLLRPESGEFQVLLRGTPDVNERWDMRRIPGR
ncbi:MAG: hypothetical protein MH204_04280 [Fimbriimonadaceae bacterium]|nr:hypothetical protein [Fimbriimonadaceae bacterium]